MNILANHNATLGTFSTRQAIRREAVKVSRACRQFDAQGMTATAKHYNQVVQGMTAAMHDVRLYATDSTVDGSGLLWNLRKQYEAKARHNTDGWCEGYANAKVIVRSLIEAARAERIANGSPCGNCANVIDPTITVCNHCSAQVAR